jgi:hypothetical protein
VFKRFVLSAPDSFFATGLPQGTYRASLRNSLFEDSSMPDYQLCAKWVNMSTRTAWERKKARYGMDCCCCCCTLSCCGMDGLVLPCILPPATTLAEAAVGRSLRIRDPLIPCIPPSPHAFPPTLLLLLLLLLPGVVMLVLLQFKLLVLPTLGLCDSLGKGMRLLVKCWAPSGRSLAAISGSRCFKPFTSLRNHRDHRVPAGPCRSQVRRVGPNYKSAACFNTPYIQYRVWKILTGSFSI